MILVTRVYVRDLPQSRPLVGRRWIYVRKYLSRDTKSESAKIGEEQGYKLAESLGMDIEDAITIATRLLKGRIAKQVWRDYHKHAFARRCYADPSDMGLKALQLSDRRREQDQTEREQLQLQHTLLTRLHHGWRRGIG